MYTYYVYIIYKYIQYVILYNTYTCMEDFAQGQHGSEKFRAKNTVANTVAICSDSGLEV
jgi:hypothetical protein